MIGEVKNACDGSLIDESVLGLTLVVNGIRLWMTEVGVFGDDGG